MDSEFRDFDLSNRGPETEGLYQTAEARGNQGLHRAVQEAPADRDPEGLNDTGPAFLNDLLPWSENLPDETICVICVTSFGHFILAFSMPLCYSGEHCTNNRNQRVFYEKYDHAAVF